MFRVYRYEDNIKAVPGLDHEGAILFAALIGADCGAPGDRKLLGIPMSQVLLAVKIGFGRLLCKSFHEGTLKQWRE